VSFLMNVRRAGEHAVLVETTDLAAAHRLHAALRADPPDGLLDVVPGERTVLITVTPRTDLQRLRRRLEMMGESESLRHEGVRIEIPVVYDGADLEEVAEITGLSVREVIERHLSSEFVVAYLGFAPGFGYLSGLDDRLHVPRRPSPRTAVPAGSVAIAGPYGAVYPRSSPGGWRLLGHTGLTLWDLADDPPALLRPGARVCFREVR
jgi:KipI family sensor histidine kinase inhibitor